MAEKYGYKIREAHPTECAALTSLALNSKAFWGYSDDFIRDCEAVLTISPDMMEKWHHGVAEVDGEAAGFYFLEVDGARAELELLYISPAFMGQGIGKALFQVAENTARELNCSALRIEADPNAMAFYQRMGARQTGWCRSDVRDARELPLMMKELSRA